MPQRPARKMAGDRRHRATIQAPTVTVDAMGGRTVVWTTFCTEWAAVDEEAKIVSESEATLFYDVTIPYRSDVANGQQVLVLDKTLKVLIAENPEGRNRDLILHCAEVA